MAVRPNGREWVYVWGAVCPATGEAVGLITADQDAEVSSAFLAQLSAALEPGVQAVLVWDGGGHHTAKSLRAPDNVTLLRLPPYSPELNPVENLWHYLREHCWSNRDYNGRDELERAAAEAWRATCDNPRTVASVCRAPYAA